MFLNRKKLYDDEWFWDSKFIHGTMDLSEDRKVVTFSINSAGTAAIVGDTPLLPDHIYYWELVFDQHLYGTDTMIGVGMKDAVTLSNDYVSLLGCNSKSWGYSYRGYIVHNESKRSYAGNFGFSKGQILGVLLNTWKNSLEYFVNGRNLGIAFENVKCSNGLYPMVSSTAAKCIVRLRYCCNMQANLQSDIMMRLAMSSDGLESIYSVPGLPRIFSRDLQLVQRIHKKNERKITEPYHLDFYMNSPVLSIVNHPRITADSVEGFVLMPVFF